MRSRIPGAFDYYDESSSDESASHTNDRTSSSPESTSISVNASSNKTRLPCKADITSDRSSHGYAGTTEGNVDSEGDRWHLTRTVQVPGGTAGQTADETDIDEMRLRQQNQTPDSTLISSKVDTEAESTDARFISDLMNGDVWSDKTAETPSAPTHPEPISAQTSDEQSWWQWATSRRNTTAATATSSPAVSSLGDTLAPPSPENNDSKTSQPPASGTGLSFYLKATAAVLAASAISYYTVGAGGGSTFRQGGETTDFLDIASNVTRVGWETAKWAVPKLYESGAWAASRVVEGSTWAGPKIAEAASTALSGASGWWGATGTAATGLG